jgi:hypothetical protein
LPDLGDVEFERRLAEARQSLESLRNGGPGRAAARDDASSAEPPGTGEAFDGRVRAVASRGRLERLELDPRSMRLPPEELGRHIGAAVSAAFDSMRSQRVTTDEAPVADPLELAENLREVQERGLREMRLISQSLSDAAARITSGQR